MNATKSDISIVFYVVFYVFWLTRWLVEIDLVLEKMQNVVFNPNFVWWLCRRVPTFRERVGENVQTGEPFITVLKEFSIGKVSL